MFCREIASNYYRTSTMISQATKLISFREELYSHFPKRKDATMNLLDALTSHGAQYGSPVQLSNSIFFEREYSSITDVIADGLPDAHWGTFPKLIYKYTIGKGHKLPNRFLVDCTAYPRPFAKKVKDRTIVHAPNPAPGNKPICVGHQYSSVALLPDNTQASEKHWLVPISAKRVESSEKGNEVGMQQIVDCINDLELTDELNISIGDSLYGTEVCRETAAKQDNLIHIFRFKSNRNIFCAATNSDDDINKRGRKKVYGDKIVLNEESTHPVPDEQIEIPWINRRNKAYNVVIKCWRDKLLRGSRQFKSSQHPINIVQITVLDRQNQPVFKRSLWIAVFGKRRHEISLADIYQNYIARYDIEHFFRFGKQKLLMVAYQTPDVEHEMLWWQLCQLAYVQLYLAKTLVPLLPQPWERYLSVYKNKQAQMMTPTQTQRGFGHVLTTIGSPAAPCIARGKPCGRIAGEILQAREYHPVIFKSKQTDESVEETIIPGSETNDNSSNPGKIQLFVETVKEKLSKMKLSLPEFTQMLLDTS